MYMNNIVTARVYYVRATLLLYMFNSFSLHKNSMKEVKFSLFSRFKKKKKMKHKRIENVPKITDLGSVKPEYKPKKSTPKFDSKPLYYLKRMK